MQLTHKINGFTLVELMITVAIVGILAAVVYPSYVSYVTKSNRTEAQRELMRLANLEEQYYVDHREYTENMKDLGLNADPFITESGRYSIDAEKQNNGFTLTATALGSQASNDSACATLSVDHTGKKTASSADCWEK
jgi:type IV pilus assembly protein PilE